MPHSSVFVRRWIRRIPSATRTTPTTTSPAFMRYSGTGHGQGNGVARTERRHRVSVRAVLPGRSPSRKPARGARIQTTRRGPRADIRRAQDPQVIDSLLITTASAVASTIPPTTMPNASSIAVRPMLMWSSALRPTPGLVSAQLFTVSVNDPPLVGCMLDRTIRSLTWQLRHETHKFPLRGDSLLFVVPPAWSQLRTPNVLDDLIPRTETEPLDVIARQLLQNKASFHEPIEKAVLNRGDRDVLIVAEPHAMIRVLLKEATHRREKRHEPVRIDVPVVVRSKD